MEKNALLDARTLHVGVIVVTGELEVSALTCSAILYFR
jgi:hypothetical protein